jgi:hypothetical protein
LQLTLGLIFALQGLVKKGAVGQGSTQGRTDILHLKCHICDARRVPL